MGIFIWLFRPSFKKVSCQLGNTTHWVFALYGSWPGYFFGKDYHLIKNVLRDEVSRPVRDNFVFVILTLSVQPLTTCYRGLARQRVASSHKRKLLFIVVSEAWPDNLRQPASVVNH